ncbi:MAG: 2TM domain-containing protein [Candidatus Bipolaricaulia bacterium]
MDEQERYRRAKRRVEALKSFYIHAGVYLVVNAALVVINLTTSTAYLWFVWPLLGWGLGLAGHAAGVFGIPGLFGREWESRKIQEYMEQEQADDPADTYR